MLPFQKMEFNVFLLIKQYFYIIVKKFCSNSKLKFEIIKLIQYVFYKIKLGENHEIKISSSKSI